MGALLVAPCEGTGMIPGVGDPEGGGCGDSEAGVWGCSFVCSLPPSSPACRMGAPHCTAPGHQPVPGDSSRPHPAQSAPTPKRDAKHPWMQENSPPSYRPAEASLPSLGSSQQGTCPAWLLRVSPCHTTPAVPRHCPWARGRGLSLQPAAGWEGWDESCRRAARMSHAGTRWDDR